MTTDRIGTLNERETVSHTIAEADFRAWLKQDEPELAGLNEWANSRNNILENLGGHWAWTRPETGGPPVLWNRTRYGLLRCWTHRLVGKGFVGRLPGRRSTLPASLATVATFQDEILDEKAALVVVHLTAEVQDRYGDYHADRARAPRVRRHKAERRALRRLVRRLRRRGFRVYVVGDTNFSNMPLRPLTSCWQGRRADGTLGGRTVDYVYAEPTAASVRTFKGHSDHKGVVATYNRKDRP